MQLISLAFIYRYHSVNINVAVQTDNGLFVPVIKVMLLPILMEWMWLFCVVVCLPVMVQMTGIHLIVAGC